MKKNVVYLQLKCSVLSRFVAAFVTARLLLFTRLVRIGPSSRAQLANRTQFTIRAALLVVWPVQLVWALFARVNATLGRIAGAGRARANLALFPSVWRPEVVIHVTTTFRHFTFRAQL